MPIIFYKEFMKDFQMYIGLTIHWPSMQLIIEGSKLLINT